MTAHRAQGITTDTSHVLVDPSTTRENLYVAMTRGRHANIVYVSTDRPDNNHTTPHPQTTRMQPPGACYTGCCSTSTPSSPPTRRSPPNKRRGGRLRSSRQSTRRSRKPPKTTASPPSSANPAFTSDEAEDTIQSDTFGALAAELRRAEANHHNIDLLMPRLVAARGFEDADDIASVLHHRLACATAHPVGSGRTRKAPRLIAGLIPEATGPISTEMRKALTQRRELIQQRAEAVLDQAISERKEWVLTLGEAPTEVTAAAAWWRQAQTVAAYRDRYGITTRTPLGPLPDGDAQKIEAARAAVALSKLGDLATQTQEADARRSQGRDRSGLVC